MNALVAIDLSPVSWTIIEQAKALLNQSGTSHFWLLHIANPEPDFVGYEPGPQAVRDAQAVDFHQQHQDLQAYAERLRAGGTACTGRRRNSLRSTSADCNASSRCPSTSNSTSRIRR